MPRTAHGYIHVVDVAEESMFVREFEHTSQVVVIFVYTDDFEIAGRTGLDILDVMSPDAHMTDSAPEAFRGMERVAARKAA